MSSIELKFLGSWFMYCDTCEDVKVYIDEELNLSEGAKIESISDEHGKLYCANCNPDNILKEPVEE